MRAKKIMTRCPFCGAHQTHDKLHKRFYECGTTANRNTAIYYANCKGNK